MQVVLADKFTYLRSSVYSKENDINTRLAKAWTANESQSLIWKSHQTDKIKCSFFPSSLSILLYECTVWTQTKSMEKKLDGNYTESHKLYWRSSVGNTPFSFWLMNAGSSNKRQTTRIRWKIVIFTGTSIYKREAVSNKNIGLVAWIRI